MIILYFQNLIFIYSAYDYTVPSKGKVLAMTDLQVQIPHGHYGRVG